MADTHDARAEASHPVRYEIRIKGHLGPQWSDWLGGLTISLEAGGETTLAGTLDQAALHGLLKQVRDLGLTLVSINQIPPSVS